MAIKIKLTERQQKLAAGEIDGSEPIDSAEALRDAGFDFVENDDSDDDSDGDNASNSTDDDDLRPSGEYIDDGVETDGNANPDDSDGNIDWADDKVRSYAASYGLTEEDLATFDSLESLQRFGTFIDRRFAASVQSGNEQSTSAGSDGSGNDSGGNGEADDSQKASSKKPNLLDKLKPLDRSRYEEAKYGEAELDLVDQLNGAIEAIRHIAPGFFQQQEQAAAQQEAQRMQEFHQALDEIDSKIYGRAYKDGKPAGKLSEAFDSNRRAVMDTMERLANGIAADAAKRGVQPQIPPVAELARRASAIVSGTIPAGGDTGSRANSEQVAAQSRRRRPAGTGGTRHAGTVGSTPDKGRSQTPADEARAIANNPAIASFFKKAQRENGVA